MTVEEILAMLDEKPVDVAMEFEPEPELPPSPQALVLDRWGITQGEYVADMPWNEELDVSDEVCADAFGACFEGMPELEANPEDHVRSKWFRDLLASSDFAAMRAHTRFETTLSEMASVDVAKRFHQYQESLTPEEKEQIDKEEPESIETELKRIRSIAAAVAEAGDVVEECVDAAALLGLCGAGNQDGESQTLDAKKIAEVYKLIREKPVLRRILDLAGRYRRLARALQSAKRVHGMDDMVDVVPAGDLTRLIPSELLALVDEDRELETMMRLIQNEAMCRKHESKAHAAKGPIVVVVDESGSMKGKKIENAKALAMALGWVALHQKRWVAFVSFQHKRDGEWIAFPPGKWDFNKLAEWLTHFYNGGTTLDVPLSTLPFQYWQEMQCPAGKTDIVIVTDGVVRCPDEMAEAFNAWKAANFVKMFGIILDHSPGSLEGVCDAHWCVDELTLETQGVSEVLSI